MKISKVKISNYKSMFDSKNVIINQDIYALIGQNNTGKSTILDAIQCLYPGERKSVEYKDFHDRSKDVSIEVEFSEVTENYIIDKLLFEQVEKNKKQLKKMKNDGKSKKEIDNKKEAYKKSLKKKIDEIVKRYEIEDEKMVFRLIVPANGSGGVGKKHYECRSNDNTISEADIKKILPALKVIPAIRNPQNESTAGSNSYMKDLIQMLDDSIQTSIKVGRKKINYNELNNIISKESNKRCAALSKAITAKYAESIGNDDFGFGTEKADIRQKWDDSYYKKWHKAIKKLYKEDADNVFEQFRTVREKLNDYTMYMAKTKKNYMLEILTNKDILGIKKGLFLGLVDKLERFVMRIN